MRSRSYFDVFAYLRGHQINQSHLTAHQCCYCIYSYKKSHSFPNQKALDQRVNYIIHTCIEKDNTILLLSKGCT